MPMSLQTPWYNKTIDALQLAGMSESTQESYARAVRMLIEYFEKDPHQITEGELQAYFLYRRNETRWSASTLKICYCALKFFFINVLQRDWHLFKILKVQPEKRLPCVLSRKEVYHILRDMKTFHNFVFLATVYSCGLRLQEALFLEVSDIDSHRMLIHVQPGKGRSSFIRTSITWCHVGRYPRKMAGGILHGPIKTSEVSKFFGNLGGLFLLPVRAMSKIYKAKFRNMMIKNGLFELIPAEAWEKDWNVNVQATGQSERTIRYLSRYVFQVAISDYRIVKVEAGKVTFRYRKPGSTRDRRMTLDAMEFIRRFLQHVLPTGFMKVRYYGFLNPNAAVNLNDVRCAIELCSGFEITTPEFEIAPVEPLYCPSCGGKLKYLCSVLPHEMPPVRDTG